MPKNQSSNNADAQNRARIARETLSASSAKPGTKARADLVASVNRFLQAG